MWRYPIKPNQVRDWQQSGPQTGNKTVRVFHDYSVVGLDIYLRNRGASSLTFRIDDQGVITLDAGDVFTWNNIKFNKIAVTSTVNYDMILAGIGLKELK